jgi:hypothetical protein
MAKWFLKNYHSFNGCWLSYLYVLIEIYDVGYMDVYFYACLIILIFFVLTYGRRWNKVPVTS